MGRRFSVFVIASHFWKRTSHHLAVGIGLSLSLHALLLATGRLAPPQSRLPVRSGDSLVQVTYFEHAGTPAPAPEPPAAAPPPVAPLTRAVAARVHVALRPAPDSVVALPAEATPPQPARASMPVESSAPASTAPTDASGAAVSGSAATQSGVPDGAATGSGGPTQILPFGPGMTRPRQISGRKPEYTRQAIAARVQGKVLARCVITSTGAVEDCQLIKGVPLLTDIVLDRLHESRFEPVTYQGRPRSIRYVFTYNFELP
ncbi:MAG: energy transducer TonB [Deltaproteobacteria bacterium]